MFLYYFCRELNHEIMKKTLLMLLAALCLPAMTASAQTQKKQEKKSMKENVSEAWSRVKDDVSQTSSNVASSLGFGNGHVDEKRIYGTYYMTIYDTNLYTGSDGQQLRLECERAFKQRYPKSVVMSVAIPQIGWLVEDIKEKKNVIGYRETLYCFIMARDGNDGYINAKFVFQRYRKAGDTYEPIDGKWPEWQRTDIIPNKAYSRLAKKK